MDPHQACMVSRGLKTLALRVERAQENAQVVAPWLEMHPAVAWVGYVGLPSHPQYELAKRQMSGSGSMIAFELKGGVETLISHPASMTHAGMARDNRIAAGITDGLVRLSVGIEDAEDIIEDLEQALARIGQLG